MAAQRLALPPGLGRATAAASPQSRPARARVLQGACVARHTICGMTRRLAGVAKKVAVMAVAGGNCAEAASPHDHYRRLLKGGVPAVLVNAAVEHLGYPRVSVDDAAAVEQAFGHLVSLGHRRVGLVIGPEDHMPSRRKLAAFLAMA